MTQFFTYDGVDLGNTTVRLADGIAGLSQSANGEPATGGVKIDDPLGALTFVELQEFAHTETACSVPRTFTGFLTNMRVSRGPYITGPGRIYDFDLIDLNYLLHLQPLRGTGAKRPAETGNARLAFLLSSVALDGIVYDNGLVGSIVDNFEEADYTGLYAETVLDDLCVSSSAEIGRIYFVYRDHATGQASLFIDIPTAAVRTSTLAISNDLDDVDDSTTFAPNLDSQVEASAQDIYCAVFFKYKAGNVYRHNDTTHATYFAGSGYHRQAVFETTRVGSQATAIRHADAFLANHAGTIDTVTCVVRLPKAKVNLIEAGQRVSSKFVHLPGFDTFGYLRVALRTVLLTQDTNDYYDVHLTLTNRSFTPGGTGSGSTGDFPFVPPPPSQFCATTPGSGVSASSTAYSTFVEAYRGVFIGAPSIVIDQFAISGYTASNYALLDIAYSWDGGAIAYASVLAESTSTPGVFNGQVCWNGGGLTRCEGDDDGTPYASTPTTWPHPDPPTPATLRIWGIRAQQNDNMGPATFCVTPGAITDGGTSLVVPNEIEGSGPPAAGQWVLNEPVADGDGSTVLFTTDFPYAAGSLHVRVDGVPIIQGLTETDPAAGTFTLDFAPKAAVGDSPAEKVVADYQGI